MAKSAVELPAFTTVLKVELGFSSPGRVGIAVVRFSKATDWLRPLMMSLVVNDVLSSGPGVAAEELNRF